MTVKISLVIWIIIGGLNLIPKGKTVDKFSYGLVWFTLICFLVAEIIR